MNNNQLVNVTNFAPGQAEINEILTVCKLLAECPYYQKLGASGILAIWLTAREMKLPPMMCLNGGMYTFSGLVSLSAQLMNMMLVNAGHRADVLELNESICKIRFWRCDRKSGHGDTFDYSFTIDQARVAGYLTKTNWKNHPRDMLYSRALSGGARKFMPDVLLNAYAHGELDNDGEIIQVMPEIANEDQIKKDNEEKNILIEDFKTKYLYDGSEYEKYVQAIVERSCKTRQEVIESAIKNVEGFLTAFEKWDKKRSKDLDNTQQDQQKID